MSSWMKGTPCIFTEYLNFLEWKTIYSNEKNTHFLIGLLSEQRAFHDPNEDNGASKPGRNDANVLKVV